MSADTWTLKLQLALHTMASASPDTESRLHYAILHKGLEHLQILVSMVILESIPCKYQETTVVFLDKCPEDRLFHKTEPESDQIVKNGAFYSCQIGQIVTILSRFWGTPIQCRLIQ